MILILKNLLRKKYLLLLLTSYLFLIQYRYQNEYL